MLSFIRLSAITAVIDCRREKRSLSVLRQRPLPVLHLPSIQK